MHPLRAKRGSWFTFSHATARAAQSRGEDTRRRILETALQVFATEGYEGASTRQLAERAGVNLPAIQYYFGSKEGLFRAVIDSIIERTETHMAPLAVEVKGALADPATLARRRWSNCSAGC